MKKFMLALLAGLMIFGLASQALAEVTVGGELEVRYDLWNNLGLNYGFGEFNSGGLGDTIRTNTQNFFADRILLHVDAKVTEGLEGYVELGTLADEGVDDRVWGIQNSANGASPMNYDAALVDVRQAWINFMVPGLPVGVKIGHQPLALGHGISLDSHRFGQDAILLYSKPIPELLVAGVYVKSLDQSSPFPNDLNGNEHHDVDVYAALANYTFMENNTVGMYYLYGHDAANAASIGVTGIGSVNDGTTERLHWIGLVADGAVGPVNYKGEFVYQDINATVTGTSTDIGFNHAWAAMLGAGTKLSLVDLNIEAAYGTGTSPNKNADSRTFITPYGTTSYNYAFIYNDKLGQNPHAGFSSIYDSSFGTNMGFNNELAYGGFGLGDGTGGFGLANTGYIKISAAVNPMERMTADMAVLYLRASSPSFNGQSLDLGWEVDGHVGYDLYDNLTLDINGGLFVPGAWYAYNGRVFGPDYSWFDGFSNTVEDETDPTTSFKRNLAYGFETKLTMKF